MNRYLTIFLDGYAFSSLFSTIRATSFLTTGEIITTIGKAMINAKPQALIQIEIMPSIRPKLKILITSDIMKDINNAMKNENTYEVYFFGINFIYFSIDT